LFPSGCSIDFPFENLSFFHSFFLTVYGIILSMTIAQIPDVGQLQKENDNLRCEVLHLREQLDWFKRQVFGKRSERIVSEISDQMKFDGFDELEKSAEEQTQTVPAHRRRKPNRNGQDAITLPPDLPVKTVVLDVPEMDGPLRHGS
jgi:hypothetical protein